jgi:hypothetical protein
MINQFDEPRASELLTIVSPPMPPKRKRSTTPSSKGNDEIRSKYKDPKSWPTAINQLFDLFKAMNVLFAFLEARVSSTTLTFTSVKSSVDGSNKTEGNGLTIDNVAALGCICPGMIRCRRDDDGEIMVDFGPSKGKKKADIARDREKMPPKIMKMSAIPQLIEKREKAFIDSVVQLLIKCQKKVRRP